jgi:hypothetical protein
MSWSGGPVELEPFGLFPDYGLVRGTLVWLDMAEPVASRERIVPPDPARAAHDEMLELWYQRVRNLPTTMAELLGRLSFE